MPKLLQINTTLNWGSTGRISEQIAKLAQQTGWECYIAHGGRYIGFSDIPSIQISSKIDNYLHALSGEILGKHGLGSITSTKKFIEKIERLQPDIIHLHNIHGYYINYQILFEYLSNANIPIVWTLHDCWSFTGHCTHFENAGCEKWKTGCNHCSLLMAQYKSRFIDRSRENYLLKRRLYNKLNNVTIVPVSYWLSNHVSQSILNRFPIHVIQNGIDIDLFKFTNNSIREKYNIPNNKTLVLGVVGSGFGQDKGKGDFASLAKNNNFQIIVVGLNEKELKNLPPNIIGVRRTGNQEELAKYYSAADVFLNPTYNESLGLTNIESMACGTPVITYNSGGSPETIDEKTGIVVEKGDITGLTKAIETIQSKGKGFFFKACRERAECYFNKNDRFKDYINLYEKIITNNTKISNGWK